MFSSTVRFLYRARWLLAPIFIALFAFSVQYARHLKLKSDFKELLPDNYQSVKDMDRILARVSGTDTLTVAIESDDSQASIRFAKDLIEKLEAYPPEMIHQIEYNVGKVRDFFEKNKYLYIDLADLQEIHDRLKRRIDREKIKSTGLFLDLETKDEKDDEFSTKDIEDKYKEKTSKYDEYIDGYFFGEGGRLMAVILRPPGAATGVDFAKELVAKVTATIAALNPSQYHPSMKTGLTGKFRRVLFEYEALIEDIVSTALLVVGLVSLVVFLYYLRLRMVFLMGWTVFCGVAWTFAATQWHIGYLTTQTAFLGSIIVGNGINYALILMSRYLEERKRGKKVLESLEVAIPHTFAATLASSVTTSAAFATLMITDMKGFSQFGFIGGLGMFACWAATYTVLPVFLAISENIWPIFRDKKKNHFEFSLIAPVAERLPGWAKKITHGGLIFTAASLLLVVFFIPRSLEYDFTKLRVKAKGLEASEEEKLNDRVRRIFSSSMTPAVLVTERGDQVVPLCDEIERKRDLDEPSNQVVESCKNMYSHVPPDQDAKLALLKKIRVLLNDSTLEFLNKEQKEEVDQFKKEFDVTKKIALKDVPENILRNFREKDGTMGKVAYVYPTDKAPLWNGKNLIRFADIIRENKLPTGEVITASGTAVIFADLLRAVIHDGPIATVLAFLAVCLVVALIFWERRACVFIIGTLLFGVVWMGGLISLLNIKLNFFNFIAIPVTFGIGVDYGVNIYQRYKLEGKGSLVKVLRTTGGAVALCSLTTLIGYATLIIAKNQALVSFGWIAILGELGCLAAALVFVPALVMGREKGRQK